MDELKKQENNLRSQDNRWEQDKSSFESPETRMEIAIEKRRKSRAANRAMKLAEDAANGVRGYWGFHRTIDPKYQHLEETDDNAWVVIADKLGDRFNKYQPLICDYARFSQFENSLITLSRQTPAQITKLVSTPWLGWQLLDRLGFRTYEDYLHSDYWIDFQKRYFAANPKICFVCGSATRVGLHHLHYRSIGAEAFEDVVPACKPCHAKIHRLVRGKSAALANAHLLAKRKYDAKRL